RVPGPAWLQLLGSLHRKPDTDPVGPKPPPGTWSAALSAAQPAKATHPRRMTAAPIPPYTDPVGPKSVASSAKQQPKARHPRRMTASPSCPPEGDSALHRSRRAEAPSGDIERSVIGREPTGLGGHDDGVEALSRPGGHHPVIVLQQGGEEAGIRQHGQQVWKGNGGHGVMVAPVPCPLGGFLADRQVQVEHVPFPPVVPAG